MRTYSPSDFVTRFSGDEIPDPIEVTVFGLAKAEAGEPECIGFSNSLCGDRWVSIPLELVQSVDHLKTVLCKEKRYPLVRIKLKWPDDRRKDVAALMGLMSQAQTASCHERSLGLLPGPARVSDGECHIAETLKGLEVCCYEHGELASNGMVYRDTAQTLNMSGHRSGSGFAAIADLLSGGIAVGFAITAAAPTALGVAAYGFVRRLKA